VRLLRVEHALVLAGTMSWDELAFACGCADQPRLIGEFRAFTDSWHEHFSETHARAAA
jgi:hypothetical protein